MKKIFFRVESFLPTFTLILCGFLFIFLNIKIWNFNHYSDFDVYYQAVVRARQGHWDEIYTLADGASPFRYIPIFLPFFSLFAYLEHVPARQVWFYFQALFFSFSYFFLYLSLLEISPSLHTSSTSSKIHSKGLKVLISLSFLLTLRLMMDSFKIGQVSSLMLLTYSFSLWAVLKNKNSWAGGALLIPTLLKIGPGISFFFFPLQQRTSNTNQSSWWRAWWTPFWISFLLIGITYFWTPSFDIFKTLFGGWFQMILADHQYIDSSHYGSQSILSFLLRLNQIIPLGSNGVQWINRIFSLFIIFGLFIFWFRFKPKNKYEKAVLYSLGIFPYLWLMPQTFKYSLHMILIPLVLLLDKMRRDKENKAISHFDLFTFIFFLITVGIAGKDVLGEALHGGIQKLSLPLFSTFFIAAALIRGLRNS